jgi:hypothetical protein
MAFDVRDCKFNLCRYLFELQKLPLDYGVLLFKPSERSAPGF